MPANLQGKTTSRRITICMYSMQGGIQNQVWVNQPWKNAQEETQAPIIYRHQKKSANAERQAELGQI